MINPDSLLPGTLLYPRGRCPYLKHELGWWWVHWMVGETLKVGSTGFGALLP